MQGAALYLRASSEHQKYSTTNQEEALRRYADEHALAVVAKYKDDGRSGLTLAGRPALRRLLADVLSLDRPFSVLLVLDVSRWGRFQDVDESAYYEFMCRRAGVKVIYCAEPYIDAESPMAAVVKSLKRAMAAEYSRELSAKVSVGHRRLFQEGFVQGGTPGLGLRRLLVDAERKPKRLLERGERKMLATDRVVLTPGPAAEVALVRRIFTLCADDQLGPTEIARLLNDEGVSTHTGRPWLAPQVGYILTNERYVGVNVFGKTVGPLKTPRRNVPRGAWLRLEGAFEATVPRPLFDRAQGVLDERRGIISNEAMLAALRALFVREGRLSGPLIDAQPEMKSASLYRWRFGSLTAAFRSVGYVAKTTPASEVRHRNQFRRIYSEDELVERLRGCLERRGRLSKTIIDADRAMPSAAVYQQRFGTLMNAYRRVGFAPAPGGRPVLRAIKDPVNPI